MIKLTVQTKTTLETHLFDQSTVIIGSRQPDANLCLPDTALLQPIHIKIVEQQGLFFVFNTANDPFATINGDPFGKREIFSNDRIEVCNATIIFDTVIDLNAEKMENLKNKTLLHQLDKHIAFPPHTTDRAYPSSVKNQKFKNHDTENLEDIALEQLILEIENEANESDQDDSFLLKPPQDPKSIKDSHLNESGGENEIWDPKTSSMKEKPSYKKTFFQKWCLAFLIPLLIATITGSLILYFYIKTTTAKEEIYAAEGLADIAMALTHAQLQTQKLYHQSWSDNEFLKGHLAAMIEDPHRLDSNADINQYFKQYFYNLRIYTSHDLSRFLLIAQPIPNVSHWVMPQSTLLIDSASMKIHTTQDLRTLNRLLDSGNLLEKDNMREISILIKHGELIPLSKLAHELQSNDFLIPSELAQIKPGAEDLIYNAPRYHHLGKPLAEAIKSLSHHGADTADAALLKKEIKALSHLSDLVLYTFQDQQAASQAKQSLAIFAPEEDNVLVGWLTFDQKGDILNSNLLLDEQQDIIAFQPNTNPLTEEQDTNETTEQNDLVDHPLYTRLIALKMTREQALTPLAGDLTSLLKEETTAPSERFSERFFELSKEFIRLDAEQKSKITTSLHALYQEFDGISFTHFISIVEEAGLKNICTNTSSNTLQSQEFLSCLEQIVETNSFVDIEKHIQKSKQQLLLSNTPDQIAFNTLRQYVFSALEKLLLTAGQPVEKSKAQEDNQAALIRILDQAWLIEPEEKEFFLNEFSSKKT